MHLYLIALVPPEPVRGQVWALKQELHQRTGSRNAIGLPPHITLVPPTRQPESFAAEATQALHQFAATQASCKVGLQDFGWFTDRTLFVQVTEAAALRHLQAALMNWCRQHLPAVRPESRPFTPHMTLATRDLSPALVPALRQDFATRTYEASFQATSLNLFRHNGRNWEKIAEFQLIA
ncbi:2'-5' RNA ligase family protein [Hymenobacter puniceus]|uniref:2'-5' RNA ligase family protein n=1 Tax=Hymenobacter sp. BT190 TaxID=2763505 RepID=UPI0016518F1A|nr:2'-5' RNA ligase family protein [Hymenobacter sp. BT190]MBC6699451.1 2'-5' RNA ligase family protein [Hymenobacter sp. BT190]